MTILRATRKLLPLLPTSVAMEATSRGAETALGDWFVNRLVVDRQPLLLLVSASSLLALVVPARDVRTLPARLPSLVAARLERMRVLRAQIDAEIAAMTPVHVAPTNSPQLLGTMNDFGRSLRAYREREDRPPLSLSEVEDRLAQTPCRLRGPVIFPEVDAPTLLAERWGGPAILPDRGWPIGLG